MLNQRRAIRLNVTNGIVILRRPDMPAIAFELLDLSETGCGCRAYQKSATSDVTEKWIEVLEKGLPIDVAITRPPYFLDYVIHAEVTHVERIASRELKLGMRFLFADRQGEKMHQTLIDVALGKLQPSIPEAQPEPITKHAAPRKERPTKMAASRLRDILATEEGHGLGFEDAEASEESPLEDFHINSMILHDPSVTALDICNALSIKSQLPVVDLDIVKVDFSMKRLFSFLTMLRFQFVPFAMSKDLICLAASAPIDPSIVKSLERQSQRHVVVFLAPADQIHELQAQFRPHPQRSDIRATRVRIEIPVQFYFCDVGGRPLDNKVRDGMTLSLSENAVMFKSSIEPEESRTRMAAPGLLIRVSLNPTSEPIRATGRIAYSKSSADENEWVYGVEFLQVAPNDVGRLQQLYEDAVISKFKRRVGVAV